jgi:hypothetical protein
MRAASSSFARQGNGAVRPRATRQLDIAAKLTPPMRL